jgi:thiol-disulfide isomerase/thioredoxin
MLNTPRPSDPDFARKRRLVILTGGMAGMIAALTGIYLIGDPSRNAGGGAQKGPDTAALCRPAVEKAQNLAPLMTGTIAAMTPAKTPLRLEMLGFKDGRGRQKQLSDWRGRVVLLNLWATWCVPCREEMPALDALQQKMIGDDFEVVAVNIDTRDPDKPRAWLQDNNIPHLGFYADPSARIFQDLKTLGRAFGMPTTILVDREGCEIASMAGPADWASPDAIRLIEAAIKR